MKSMPWLSDLEKGMFTLPESPEREVPGVLVARNGIFRLELIGTFSDDAAAGLTFSRRAYPVVWGWLSKGGPVTLLNCSGMESFSAPGMSTEQVSFMAAVKGHRFEDAEELHFDSVYAHFSGLSTWIGIHGLESAFALKDDSSSSELWTARYVRPSPLTWVLADGTKVSVHFTATFPSTSGRGDVTLLQDCNLEVHPSTQEPLFDLRKRVHDLQLLFKVFSGFRMHATFDSVTRSQISSEDRVTFLPILINRRAAVEVGAALPEPWDALVPYKEISDRMQSCLHLWPEMLRSYGDAIRVAMADIEGLPLEIKVANYANSILRYHEASEKRKLLLKDVLTSVVGRYCAANAVPRAVELIETSRHFYTHFNPDLANRAATGAELANIADLLDLIHRCVLLERIGFEAAEIHTWIRRSHRYQNFLSMDRWSDTF